MKKVIIKFLIKHKLIQELDLVTILKLVKSDYIKRNKKRQNSSGICYCVENIIKNVLLINNNISAYKLKVTIVNHISVAALSAFGAYSNYDEFYSDVRYRKSFNTKKRSFTKEQLKVLGDINRRQLHTFIIKGKEILAYSKKMLLKNIIININKMDGFIKEKI